MPGIDLRVESLGFPVNPSVREWPLTTPRTPAWGIAMTEHTPTQEPVAGIQHEGESTKHTPGPWIWDEPSNWLGLHARVFIPEPYGVVAQVPIEAWRPRSRGRANARLIAAAPELLAALKGLDAYM